MFCLHCGQKLDKAAVRFCFKCGKGIREKEQVGIKLIKPALFSANLFLQVLKKTSLLSQRVAIRFNKKKVFIFVLTVSVLVGGIYYGQFFYNINKVKTAESQEKINFQLQQTQTVLQETQKELQDIKSQVGEQKTQQSKELAETKEELLGLKSKNSELRNLVNNQGSFSKAPASPASTSDFVSKNGKYVVKVFCVDSFNNIDAGSGVIMGKTGNNATLIITNDHVIPKSYTTALDYPCIVAYSSNPTVNLTNYYYAQPVYFASRASSSTMGVYDFNYLELKQEVSLGDDITVIPNASLILAVDGRPKVCKGSDILVGNKVLILGYAGVGGTYLTAKEGIISGFDTVYASTSAKIEQGDSGGGAFLPDSDCLIGMPTFSVSGKIESLGRILMLGYISNFIVQLPELGN